MGLPELVTEGKVEAIDVDLDEFSSLRRKIICCVCDMGSRVFEKKEGRTLTIIFRENERGS